MGMLQVVIGIVFVLLLLSLFATTVMELLASALGLRGKNLEKALRNMLATADIDDKFLETFKSNSLYKQLSYKYGKTRYNPSYLSPESFQSILFDIILKGEGVEKLEAKIAELPDEDLRNVLKQLLVQADNNIDNFKKHIQGWFNDVMDRASGWYKRYTQKILVVLGLTIAIVFNADTLAIYERLESDPQSLQQVVGLAEEFVAKNGTDELTQVDPTFEQSYTELKNMVNTQISAVKSPLGLGWKNVDLAKNSAYDWLAKLLGWFVTAMAISLGAPFWFDLLRKIVNLRSSGNKPGE